MKHTVLSAAVAVAFGWCGNAHAVRHPGTVIGRQADLYPEYDYIVVGGGLSGLVVANRLTEDESTTVLVIEAGGIDNYSQQIQYPRFISTAGTNNSWPITSLPIPGLNNRTAPVASARILGGGSAINGMAFDRGSPGDYNLWGELIGDDTWSWEGLLPYFKKSETFTPPTEAQQKELGISFDLNAHGSTGPVQASYPPWISTTGKSFIQALRQLGIPVQRDGAMNALGGFWYPNSLDPVTRERSYARTTFHDIAKSRPNYHILPGTLVTKLTSDLTSVEYITPYNPALNATPPGAKTSKVQARKEIIMAAGGIHTPKILQLSGIGSMVVLKTLGIEQVLELPGVGENFQDHATVYGSLSLTNLSDPTQDPTYLISNTTYDAEMGTLYELNRTGPWTASTENTFSFLTAQHLNFSSTNFIHAANQPAAQYLRPGLNSTIINGYEKVKAAIVNSMMENKIALTENLFGGVASLQKPLSRGSVHAASSDPYAMPAVNYRSFSNPLDLKMFVQALRFNADILPSTPALHAIGAIVQSPTPGSSDAELVEFIRESAFPSFSHPTGTCAMLKLEDGGCIDSQLRLYGSGGRIRVVDASIMPVVPSTHTQSTVYAVAEKAADIIKGVAL
ncbi:GMC family oxidoreductase [Aspergillus stella-maris]|uniref:GMC family oxidoreductase n=1 Tax=Aspergillus stella-maris TaxID=1810926 RepID=UPI003CCDBB91